MHPSRTVQSGNSFCILAPVPYIFKMGIIIVRGPAVCRIKGRTESREYSFTHIKITSGARERAQDSSMDNARTSRCSSVWSQRWRMMRPLLRIASRLEPRAMNVTSFPAFVRAEPRIPPVPPAPRIIYFKFIKNSFLNSNLDCFVRCDALLQSAKTSR